MAFGTPSRIETNNISDSTAPFFQNATFIPKTTSGIGNSNTTTIFDVNSTKRGIPTLTHKAVVKRGGKKNGEPNLKTSEAKVCPGLGIENVDNDNHDSEKRGHNDDVKFLRTGNSDFVCKKVIPDICEQNLQTNRFPNDKGIH